MTTQTKPTLEQLRELHAQKVAARDAAQASRARFTRELEARQDEEVRLRSLVKSGDVAAHELAKPQGAASNLRALVVELDGDISALDGEIILIEQEIEKASKLAQKRSYATRANEAATRIQRTVNRVAVALQTGLEEIREAEADWLKERAEFRAIALTEIDAAEYDGPPQQGYTPLSAHDKRAHKAEKLLAEIAADGTSTENVWGALPNNRPFEGADVPKSSGEVAAPLAAKVVEIFRERGRVKLT